MVQQSGPHAQRSVAASIFLAVGGEVFAETWSRAMNFRSLMLLLAVGRRSVLVQ
jgi:hypothetical protein